MITVNESMLIALIIIIIICCISVFYIIFKNKNGMSDYIIKDVSNVKNRTNYTNDYNIAVCMWYDDNIKEYADMAQYINRIYCIKYDMDFIFDNTRRLPDRDPTWECIPMLINALDTDLYDYVLWIDADAIFNFDCNFSLNDLIRQNQNKDILFAGEPNYENENKKRFPDTICCGIMLFKNTVFCKGLLSLIKNSKEKKCKLYREKYHEQTCMRYYYFTNYNNIQERSIIIPYKKFQFFHRDEPENFEETLILHYAAQTKKDRVKRIKKKLDKFNKNHFKYLNDVIIN